MIFTACPNCGFREPADSIGEALKKANEHNAGCREQRVKAPERVRFGFDRGPVPNDAEWRSRRA